MKILITTFTYAPNKDGVSEACRVLAEGLAAIGSEVSVATSMTYESDMVPNPTYLNGVTVVHFCSGSKTFNSDSEREDVEQFYAFVRKEKFDVVINQCWDSRLARYLHAIRRTMHSRFVLVSHGYACHIMDWQKNPFKGWGMWLRGMLFTLWDFPRMLAAHDEVVFLSGKKDFNRFFDHLAASAIRHRGIHVIANGIDLKQFPDTDEGFREKHGIGNALMALCVANYSERKNQLLAVRAFREANVPGSVLVLIGSQFNDYSERARKLDSRLSAAHADCRVLFLEKLPREETFAAYVACDLFLLTAKAETQPIVLIEAMASGKPWISTDTGCVSEMAGGVVCRKAKELPDAIRRLFSDEAERWRLGALGKAEAFSKHDATKTASKFDAVLRSSLNS